MRLFLAVALLFAVFQSNLADEPEPVVEPDFLLIAAKDVAGTVRKSADYVLYVNAAAATLVDNVDEESEAWRTMRRSLGEIFAEGSRSSLHVRLYYGENPRVAPDVPSALEKSVKRQLADLSAFVIWIDSEHRNDKKPWKDRWEELRGKGVKKPS